MTDTADIYLVQGERTFSGWNGATISIFPAAPRAADMASTGLRWPLDGLEFPRGYGGISNVAVSDVVRITVGIGRLLVVKSLARDA